MKNVLFLSNKQVMTIVIVMWKITFKKTCIEQLLVTLILVSGVYKATLRSTLHHNLFTHCHTYSADMTCDKKLNFINLCWFTVPLNYYKYCEVGNHYFFSQSSSRIIAVEGDLCRQVHFCSLKTDYRISFEPDHSSFKQGM